MWWSQLFLDSHSICNPCPASWRKSGQKDCVSRHRPCRGKMMKSVRVPLWCRLECPWRKSWTLEFLKPFSFWRKEYILFNYLGKKREWMLIFSIDIRKINSKIILNLQLPGISALFCTASDNKYFIICYVQSVCAYIHIYTYIYVCIYVYINMYIYIKQ